jgi:hypothetical protein
MTWVASTWPATGDNTGSDFVELTHYTGERFRR